MSGNQNAIARDHNLLFGVIAVQLHFISPADLARAAAVWATEPDQDLGNIIEGMGLLNDDKRRVINQLLELKVEDHGGDPSATLASMGGDRAVHESFAASIAISDEKIAASLQSFGGHAHDVPEHEGPAAGKRLDDVEQITVEHPGRYTLKGEAGRGAIGQVLVAFDEHIGREVALKELLPERGGASLPSSGSGPLRITAETSARFLREARITGQLEHPGIVPVYEIAKRPDGSIYYTMRLVRGKTLSQKLKECRRLSDRLLILPHFLHLCQAMAYAHDKGVIHRDLKPANIMVGEFGETVVLDWGLAKVRGLEDVRANELEESLMLITEAGASETVSGKPIGTPAYMSPEQAEGDIPTIDEKSDVWSLGALLYEILTGNTPFAGSSAYEVMGKVIKDPLIPIKEIEPKAPAELCAIAEKCLSKKPRKRYKNAQKLSDDVVLFQSGGLVGAFEYPVWRLIGRWFNRHWKHLVFATGGLAGAIVFSLRAIFTVVFHFHQDKIFSQEAHDACNLSLENKRLEKFFKLPTGPGNAARDLMKSSHHSMCDGEKCESLLPYDWIGQVNLEMVRSDNPEDRARLREWSKIEEVDIYRGAAKKGGYQMWGVEIFPKPGTHWMEVPIPYYLDFHLFSCLGMVRARELEEQGKIEESQAWYHDIMRNANHMERGILISQLVAIKIKLETSEEIVEFYKRLGDEELAEQWTQYIKSQEHRKKTIKDTLKNIYIFSEEEIKKVVEDPNLSTGMRMEFYWMLMLRMCYSNPRRFLLGPSKADREYLFKDRFERPEMKLFHLTWVNEVKGGPVYRIGRGANILWMYYKYYL